MSQVSASVTVSTRGPWNFVLQDGVRQCVDLHLYETRPDGSLHYGSAIDGEAYPAEALSGRGVISDTAARCEVAIGGSRCPRREAGDRPATR